jgi:hypothetical protein
MVPTFGLQAHFPAQIEWVGQTATKLASFMNSTVQGKLQRSLQAP